MIETLADVMLARYPGAYSIGQWSRVCGQATAAVAREVGTGTLYIEPGSPWENGYCESFNGKMRDECLNGEIFYSLKEAQIVIEKWRVEYNTQDRTRRWAIGRRRRRQSWPSKRGMGMWKTLRVSHIPTPPTTTTDKDPTRRYTNIPLGTKHRSGQTKSA